MLEIVHHVLTPGFYKLKLEEESYSDPFYIEEETEMGFKKEHKLIKIEEPEGFFATKEIIKARLDACSECPLKKLNFCTSCGCFLPAKTKISKASCPEGKW